MTADSSFCGATLVETCTTWSAMEVPESCRSSRDLRKYGEEAPLVSLRAEEDFLNWGNAAATYQENWTSTSRNRPDCEISCVAGRSFEDG